VNSKDKVVSVLN